MGDDPLKYCTFWNTTGKCFESCIFKHECLVCHSSKHGSWECFDAFESRHELGRMTVNIRQPRSSSLQLSLSSSEVRTDRSDVHSRSPCFQFNETKSCDGKGCARNHICAVCGSSEHGWSVCKKRYLCLVYSKGRCNLGDSCLKSHTCILCHEKHPMGDPLCLMYGSRVKGSSSKHPLGYCLVWNAVGGERQCHNTKCKYKHRCLYCDSKGHGSFDCLHGLKMICDQ